MAESLFVAYKNIDAARLSCSLVEMKPDAFDIEITQATPADVGTAAPLFDAYRQFYKRAANEEAARRFLFARLSKGESVMFLAWRGNKAVGFVHLYPVFSSTNLTRQWILNDLYVHPDSRKHGVARALLKRARQLAESTQTNGLTLETASDNHPAQRLYEQLGWKRDEQFYRYYLAL
jgi:GNAT superfamily N-acetyltransferase